MGVLALDDVIIRDPCSIGIVAPDDASIGVFVVDDEDLTAVLVREEGHAIIVVAEGAGLAISGAACRMVEFRNIRKQGITPAGGDMRIIAFRHDDAVIGAGGNGLEAKPVVSGFSRNGRQRGGSHAEGRDAAEGKHATHETTSRNRFLDDRIELTVFRFRIDNFIKVVE